MKWETNSERKEEGSRQNVKEEIDKGVETVSGGN